MHIVIIGHPRSRTSFLCDAFSRHYECSNFHEVLDFSKSLSKEILKGKLLKNLSNELIADKHLDFLNLSMAKVFNQKSATLKLFPRHIINTHIENMEYPYSLKKLENINFQIIPNFDRVVRLSEFDKIVILNRNLIDATLSYVFNVHISPIPLLLNDQDKKFLHKKFPQTEIKPEHYDHINFFIFEYMLGKHINDYICQNYQVIHLNYDNCVDYVKTNLSPTLKSSFTETEINYKTFVTNYEEVATYINSVYEKLLDYKFNL